MRRSSIWLSLALGLALVGGQSVSATDYWDLATLNDNFVFTRNELVHGTSQQHDLQANGALEGLVADQDWYLTLSYPNSSYEAVIDGTGGDITPFVGLDRIASDGTTVLQIGMDANPGGGGGFSRRLAWENTTTNTDVQYLRVQSGGCTTDCLPKDQYRIRFRETTVSVPRFNNALGQVTVLIIQNSTGWNGNIPIAGTIYFWNTAGALLGSQTFSLIGRAALVLNTASVGGVAGKSGTITVAHDGGYGNLAVKSVALEPTTGFSFDTPGLYKPQ
jgi:hypothetical protein